MGRELWNLYGPTETNVCTYHHVSRKDLDGIYSAVSRSLAAWADAFAPAVRVGCPADAFNELGQDWGLPPWKPDELAAATFSVSNLGMLGVTRFGAIVSPGQGAILAVGAAVDRFVPVDGEPVLRPIATLTLTCDHRVVYGAHAAGFLERVRTLRDLTKGRAGLPARNRSRARAQKAEGADFLLELTDRKSVV